VFNHLHMTVPQQLILHPLFYIPLHVCSKYSHKPDSLKMKVRNMKNEPDKKKSLINLITDLIVTPIMMVAFIAIIYILITKDISNFDLLAIIVISLLLFGYAKLRWF